MTEPSCITCVNHGAVEQIETCHDCIMGEPGSHAYPNYTPKTPRPSSRYPFTESADFIRGLSTSPQILNRSDAAAAKSKCAAILGISDEEMAKVFADAGRYRQILPTLRTIADDLYQTGIV